MSCSWEVLCTGWPAICNICGMIAGCLPEGHLRSEQAVFSGLGGVETTWNR